MPRHPVPLLLALAFALAGCGSGEPVTAARDAPLKVSVAKVGQPASAGPIEAAGTAALRKEIPLGFTSAGRIAQILVQEGDFVRRGQLLATLDTTSVGASLAAASAERVRARAELARFRTLMAAIERAGEIRFLPVLLTSVTAIGGLLPLALSGNPLYAPLAWVIIGGLVSSTLLSRIVIPAMYLLLVRGAPPPG